MTRRRPGRGGFTLIELVIVLTLSAIMLSFAGLALGQYFGRTSARRAAQLFSQDLTQARMFAVRAREPVVVRFFEGGLRYEIATRDTGTEIVNRRFANAAGIDLSAISLDLDGDSVVFNRRGFADLSGATGSLGVASFSAGSASYQVSFNSLGASRIDAP
jgi:prepilin-type N-terminal cleavage/methylation domain-containing protein